MKKNFIQKNRVRLSFLFLLIVTCVPCSSSFSLQPFARQKSRSTTAIAFQTSMDELPNQIFGFSELNLDSSIYLAAKDVLYQTTDYISSNQDIVEGAVLQDLAHVALDLSSFFICPENTALLRLVDFIGRLLCILSDYIPDHSLRPDELAFQISYLGISSALISKSIFPRIKASFPRSLPNRRDVIAYRSFFEPVGISWIQYKMLLASNALVWVETRADDNHPQVKREVDDNDDNKDSIDDLAQNEKNFHWVYNECNRSFVVPEYIRKLAGIDFLRSLEKRKNRNKNYSLLSSMSPLNQDVDVQHQFLQDKNNLHEDRIMLQINTEKMIDAMEDNEELFFSILFLVVGCL